MTEKDRDTYSTAALAGLNSAAMLSLVKKFLLENIQTRPIPANERDYITAIVARITALGS